MQFMNQKSFHPASKANLKKLWVAEQKAKDDSQREKLRTEELNKERSLMRQRSKRKSEIEQLDFMYNVPISAKKDTSELQKKDTPVGPVPPSVHPKDNLAHPLLKNAPKEGDYVNKLDIKNYRPLGIQIRNVRCVRCGQKGHASGDRECPLANTNPNDEARKRAEDPAALIHIAGIVPYSDNIVIKDYLRKEHQGEKCDLLPDESEESDPESAFLESLSIKEKKKLLKALKKEDKKSKKHRTREKHEQKKFKGKRHRNSSSEDEDQGHKRSRRQATTTLDKKD